MKAHEDDDLNNHWKVTKDIPIAYILGVVGSVLLQTVFLAWMASNLWTRVGSIEDHMKGSEHQGEQIAVIQEKVTSLQSTVNRLESWLQQNMPVKKP